MKLKSFLYFIQSVLRTVYKYATSEEAMAAFYDVRSFYHNYLSFPARVGYAAVGTVSFSILVAEYGFYYPPEWNLIFSYTVPFLIYYMIFYEVFALIFCEKGPRHYFERHRLEFGVISLIILQWFFLEVVLEFFTAFRSPTEEVAIIFLSYSQGLILFNNIIHFIRNARIAQSLHLSPSIVFLFSFASVIGTGTLFLLFPKSHTGALETVDALFIAVSATSVTGLSTVVVPDAFTRTGQVVILIMIQIGGLGLMTLTSFFAYYLAGQSSLHTGVQMKNLLSEDSIGRVKDLIKDIAMFAFGIEFLGAMYLFLTTPAGLFKSMGDRIFSAVFHSVSAFCNAGFSLFPQGLYDITATEGYSYLSGIMVLIVLGGLGFPILSQLHKRLMHRSKRIFVYSISAKLVFYMSSLLWLLGFITYYTLESEYTLKGKSLAEQAFHSLFYSVTMRTAGFNSLDVASIGVPMAFVSLFFMWVGASPASTGGGIKSSTLAVAVLHVYGQLRGKENVEIYHRIIAPQVLARASSTVMLSLFTVFTGIFIIVMNEPDHNFLNITYEVVSAFGTVGLSRGITGDLSDASKITLSVIMLVGRVGVFTFILAFTPQVEPVRYKYPVEYVMVG